jgi:hypothetical protein
MPETETRTLWKFSDAVVLAGVPAFLYLLTLSYQVSAALTFGIPTQLITITWTETFGIGLILSTITAFLFLLAFLILSGISFIWSPSTPRPNYVIAVKNLPWMLSLAQAIYFIWANWHRTRLLLFFGSILLGFVLGMLMQRERRIHDQANAAEAKRWAYGATLIFWGFAGLSTAITCGTVLAQYERSYFVFQSSPDTVVLAIWGDTVVAAPFDRSTKALKGDFIITKISDHSALDIRLEKVGPLHTSAPPVALIPRQ